jgi:hypothetical protein
MHLQNGRGPDRPLDDSHGDVLSTVHNDRDALPRTAPSD